MADNYSSSHSRPVSWDKPSGSGGQSRPLEVITISDSDDEQPAEVKQTSGPVELEVAKSVDPSSGQTSGCPSVMTVTPVAGAVRGSPAASLPGSRLPSTPRQDEPGGSSKVVVKVESGTTTSSQATPSMSQKKRLLAKAHSDWILSEPKPEPGEASQRYSSYEYLDRQRDRELERYERDRADKERERLEREQQERLRAEMERLERREREDRLAREREHRDQLERERLERERAEYDYHAAVMSARERDLRELTGVVPRLELAPPLAHQADYGEVHRSAVEYIQPPAAHSNRDLLAVHRSAQHPAHESLYAPATVYVTAAGYQQIAIPPPAHHHARPVLPPPMQPAAVFQHPAGVAQYGYAPLSPGKTRYLY